jgi:anthranilate synthase component 1
VDLRREAPNICAATSAATTSAAWAGTVRVTDSLPSNDSRMHIVSMLSELVAPQLHRRLAAGFHAGTVSRRGARHGIIDELETDKRGICGGCIGYFGAGSQMVCIVLRRS